MSDTERIALKEWAVLVDAMASGSLVALVRKGGIREQRAGFSVHHDRFLLYPTWFHEKPGELAPRFVPALDAAARDRPSAGEVRIAQIATVAALWWVESLDALRAIEGEVGLAWPAIESRFRYRDNPGVHVIAVRVAALPRAVTVPETPRYRGCVSWVALDQAVPVADARPALDDSAFHARLTALERALGAPLATPLATPLTARGVAADHDAETKKRA